MADDATAQAFAAYRTAHNRMVLEAVFELGPGPVKATAISAHQDLSPHLIEAAAARLVDQGKLTQVSARTWEIAK